MNSAAKKVTTEVSLDCWKKLKMISISREITLQEVVTDILQKYTNKKIFNEIVEPV